MSEKNIILFVHSATKETIDSLNRYGRKNKQKFKIGVITDNKKESPKEKDLSLGVDFFISCDLNKPTKIEKALLPYKDQLLAITSRSEQNVHPFSKIIPHVPYVRTPTAQSLLWSTDKISMRELLYTHDKTITPKFAVVSKVDKDSIKKIKKKVGFPLVIKPAGLATSLLVSICYHKEELEKTLTKTFKKISKVYKEEKRRNIQPKVLVEQFMEGGMYSIDAYVSSRGKTYFCPLVHVKTGRAIGFDDFFGYQRITPTTLKRGTIDEAEKVAQKSIKALNLRSTSVHIELMRTEDGWKIIELGPRIGGFRHIMYQLAFDIDHSLNDVLIRIPKKPILPKKYKGYCAVLQFFAPKEGILKELKGIKKVQELVSLDNLKLNKKVGDRCLYAKNGGKSICDVTLFNKNRSDLLADIRRLEQTLVIKTSRG